MNRRSAPRSRQAAPPSLGAVQSKLLRIVCRHEQLKVTFHQLRSQIGTGLLEAEDVLASLAIPLMKLVGLKTFEMAAERRFSTIITSSDHSDSQSFQAIGIDLKKASFLSIFMGCDSLSFGFPLQASVDRNTDLPEPIRERDRDRELLGAIERDFHSKFNCLRLKASKEENFMSKAMTAGNELLERQKLQIMQLISLLKRIEDQVNSSQNSIYQNLNNHHALIKRFFSKAFAYVSSIHHSGQNNDLSNMMLKILKATYDQVGAAIGSVEVGIDDMICELAKKMCIPMVEYVNGLKVEMKTGTCSCLLEVIKEMHQAMQVRMLELEEARNQATLAEQSRIDALKRLKKSEETSRRLTISLGLLTEDTTAPEEKSAQEKCLSMKEDNTKDENLLWELLRKKRKCQVPDSPVGPKELLGIATSNKKLASKRVIPSIGHRPITRSKSKMPDLHSSFANSRMLLGSSPSASNNSKSSISRECR